MRKVLQLAAFDVWRTVSEWQSFIWMLLLPLALMYLFGNLDQGGGGAPAAHITVVDRDRTWLSEAFVAELEADEQINVDRIDPDAAATTENKVRTLYIPAGFAAGVFGGEQQTLRLEKDPDTSDDFALAAEARIVRTIVTTLGRLIEMHQAGELPDDGAGAEQAAERFVALGEREPLVGLAVSTAGAGRPVPSGRAQSVPGILVMSVLMMTLIYGAVMITEEKQGGMLRRMMTLPLGRRHVFAGKLAGRFVLAALQVIVLLLAGRFLYGLSYGASMAGLVLLMASFCAATAGFATMLGAVLRTPEQAGALGWLLGMLLAALGGCWWPSEIMPGWMWQAAHVLPTAWAMDGFHALISFGYGLPAVIVPSLVLLGFAVVFSIIGARFLRTVGGVA
jgi:ABC-type multidrug transport system permease subunit